LRTAKAVFFTFLKTNAFFDSWADLGSTSLRSLRELRLGKPPLSLRRSEPRLSRIHFQVLPPEKCGLFTRDL
jgi:hypothetical protein